MENEQQNMESGKKGKMKKSTKTIIIIVIIVILVIIFSIVMRQSSAAATVDGASISKSSVSQRLETQYGKQVLDSFVAEKLIQEEANKRGIKITAEAVDGELAKIKSQVESQGGKFDDALKMQGISVDELKKQINLQMSLAEILKDKIQVTDLEVATYVKDNKITIPDGKDAEVMAQVKFEISQQKLGSEVTAWLSDAKAKAKIQYFVNY
ncbi:MAG: SurA N-terminal domain-containing protein [Candidatus Taylorbacteria bacterium]